MTMKRTSSFLFALFLWLLIGGGALADEGGLRSVRALLDDGRAEEALRVLGELDKTTRQSAEGLLLRSTARIILGDAAAGYGDLEEALALDPTLRQGWLNLAGLEIAEGRFDAAFTALERARELDPGAIDSHLNLGAVRVMQGRLREAEAHFKRYLAAAPSSAEAYYLVASNYAISGYEPPAVEHLRRAIELDERIRLRARSDERFLALQSAEYRKLLTTDSYVPPVDSHRAAAAFQSSYRRGDPQLVYAVLDALQEHGLSYDPQVEATEDWALIWGDLRIKIYNQANGTSVVRLSAPADRFAPESWRSRTQALFRTVHESLAQGERQRMRLPPPP